MEFDHACILGIKKYLPWYPELQVVGPEEDDFAFGYIDAHLEYVDGNGAQLCMFW